MAKFTDLPDEILLLCLSNIMPDDILSFTSITRHVYNISIDLRAEHQRLTEEFGVCVVSEDDEDLVELAQRIIKQERARYYVRELNLVTWHFQRPDFGRQSKDSGDGPSIQASTLEQILWSNEDRQECIDHVRSGNQLPVLSGLSIVCENLWRLSLQIDEAEDAEDLTRRLEDRDKINHGMPSSLRRFEIGTSPELELAPLVALLWQVADIATVRCIKISHMRATDQELRSLDRAPKRKFLVSTLIFYDCNIESRVIYFLLGHFPNLSHFGIDAKYYYVDRNVQAMRQRQAYLCDIDGFLISQALFAHASKLLKSLVIRRGVQCNDDNLGIGDINALESLTYLAIDIQFLEVRGHYKAVYLPTSLQRIDISTISQQTSFPAF